MEAHATKRPERPFRRLMGRVTSVLTYVGIAFLMVMMIVIVVDVLGRASINQPFLGTIEIVQYCMIGIIFFCLGHIQIAGGNITVEIVVDRLPKRTQDIIQLITTVFSIGVNICFAWAGWLQLQYLQESGSLSPVLEVADWPFAGVIGFGYLILVLVLITDIVMLVDRLRGPYEEPDRQAQAV